MMKEQINVNVYKALSKETGDDERYTAAVKLGTAMSLCVALDDSLKAFKVDFPQFSTYKIRSLASPVANLAVTAKQILMQESISNNELYKASETQKDTALGIQIIGEAIQRLYLEKSRDELLNKVYQLCKTYMDKDQKEVEKMVIKMEREKAKVEAKAAREAAKKGGGNG